MARPRRRLHGKSRAVREDARLRAQPAPQAYGYAFWYARHSSELRLVELLQQLRFMHAVSAARRLDVLPVRSSMQLAVTRPAGTTGRSSSMSATARLGRPDSTCRVGPPAPGGAILMRST